MAKSWAFTNPDGAIMPRHAQVGLSWRRGEPNPVPPLPVLAVSRGEHMTYHEVGAIVDLRGRAH